MSKPIYSSFIKDTSSRLNRSVIMTNGRAYAGTTYVRPLTFEENLYALYYEIAYTDVQQIIFGSPEKYITNLIAFPCNFANLISGNIDDLYVRNNIIEATVEIGDIDRFRARGKYCNDSVLLYMGSILYPYWNSNKYYHRSGYTKLRLFLPYLGFVDLSPNDFIGENNKYIGITLSVDVKTGNATYIITSCNDEMYLNGTLIIADNVNTKSTRNRIISQHTFELGYKIPLGSTNSTDLARNLLLAGVKGVSGIASAGLSSLAGAGIITTTDSGGATYTRTERNPSSGRQITAGTRSYNKNYSKVTNMSRRYRGKAINECFNALGDAVSSVFMDGHCDRPNNINALINCPRNAYLQIFTPKVKSQDGYARLYGKPLGIVKDLKDVSGYTEISKLHIEGKDFSNATSEELELLSTALSGGVIMPSKFGGVKITANYAESASCYYKLDNNDWQLITGQLDTGFNNYNLLVKMNGDNNRITITRATTTLLDIRIPKGTEFDISGYVESNCTVSLYSR